VKFTSWVFLAFVGSLIFLVLFIKDQEIKMGVDRLRKLNASPPSVLEADPNLKLVSERTRNQFGRHDHDDHDRRS
jgi:hypothetical protein